MIAVTYAQAVLALTWLIVGGIIGAALATQTEIDVRYSEEVGRSMSELRAQAEVELRGGGKKRHLALQMVPVRVALWAFLRLFVVFALIFAAAMIIPKVSGVGAAVPGAYSAVSLFAGALGGKYARYLYWKRRGDRREHEPLSPK